MHGRALSRRISSSLAAIPTPVPVPVPESLQAGGSLPLPARGMIHVWSLVLSTAGIDELLPLLANDERIRAGEFIFKKDHDRYVAVRGWLRRLCGAYLRQAPETLRFRYGAAGKPALIGDERGVDLRFNVSHTHDMALLAFTLEREIGVDIEYVDRQVDTVDLARTCFSDDEQRSFSAHQADQRMELFFQYWTSKEAYIKALGDGLSMPLQEFTVDIRPGTPIRSVTTLDRAALLFTVQQLSLPAGYAGAIAAEGDDWRVQPIIL